MRVIWINNACNSTRIRIGQNWKFKADLTGHTLNFKEWSFVPTYHRIQNLPIIGRIFYSKIMLDPFILPLLLRFKALSKWSICFSLISISFYKKTSMLPTNRSIQTNRQILQFYLYIRAKKSGARNNQKCLYIIAHED